MEQKEQPKQNSGKEAALQKLLAADLKLKYENDGYSIQYPKDIIGLLNSIDFDDLSFKNRQAIYDNVVQIAKDFLGGNIENNGKTEHTKEVYDIMNRRIVTRYSNAAEMVAWVKEHNLNFDFLIEGAMVNRLNEDLKWIKSMNDEELNKYFAVNSVDRDDTELRLLYSLSSYIENPFGKNILSKEIDAIENRMATVSMQDTKKNIAHRIVSAMSMESRERLMQTDQFEKEMDTMIAVEHDGVITGKNKNGEYYFYLVGEENDKWLIQNYYMMSYSPTAEIRNVAVVNEGNQQVILNISTRDLLESLDNKEMSRKLTQDARKNFKREDSEPAKLYDLPRDKPVSYLRIFPQDMDPVMSSLAHGSAIKRHVLENKYPNVESGRIIEKNPLLTLEEKIRTQYEKGVRFFFLDFYSHGSKSQLASFDPPVEFQEIETLMEKFPLARFHIETAACYGGGFITPKTIERLANSPLGKRITLLTQTKNAVVNPMALMNDSRRGKEKMYSSYYQLYVLYNLIQGATYGAAHLDADRKTKTFERIDPEMIMNGDYISEISNKKDKEEGLV